MLESINKVIKHGQFINGPEVQEFAVKLAEYLEVKHVIPCANGTDALQLAMMAKLNPGDEIIVPAFTYIAPAEAAKLLGLKIVYADVDFGTYNLDPEKLPLSKNTKAIVAVHLFGQQCDMVRLKKIAKDNKIYLIEDNAQSLGSTCNGKYLTGDVGTTSFFPSKNLSCFGDGGAVYTNNDLLAKKIKALANHGQTRVKYYHDYVGINSRLDTIQAAILLEKLKTLDQKITEQIKRAAILSKTYGMPEIYNPHTFNNFTITVKNREKFMKEVKSRIYYPLPVYKQKAYKQDIKLEVTERLCKQVVTLL
jgi:dTDP-4-amino-4,6-dideoxygalactose transaminase